MSNMVFFDPRKKKEDDESSEEVKMTRNEFIGGLLGILLLPAVFMLLWNWLLPTLFAFPAIGYFQSAGLLVLFQLIKK